MIDEINEPVPSLAAAPAALPDGSAPVLLASRVVRWFWLALGVLAAVCVISLAFAWKADQRGASLEQELVLREQESTATSADARALAKQARDTVGDMAAKVALLEARVAEVSVQRGQLEDLIQSLSRSRDENVLIDIEASIRVALQQTAITGSAEPLVASLKQGDERLARHAQPRLEGVRRAIARDLDRVKATSVADIASLGIKLDEAIRLVDELPLLATGSTRGGREPASAAAGGHAADLADAASSMPASGASPAWRRWLADTWDAVGDKVWNEAKSLVRVTRIDHPEAMLLAPDQSFFVRENLKLRLLNARLALLSRQFDTAQADLQAAQTALERYFERAAKRTVLVIELIRQVAGQARQVVVPRPDDTLAALTAASAGR